jgi:hypothetical protein
MNGLGYDEFEESVNEIIYQILLSSGRFYPNEDFFAIAGRRMQINWVFESDRVNAVNITIFPR